MISPARANRWISKGSWTICVVALIVTLGILISLFWFVAVRGAAAIRPSLFTMPTIGLTGGLANAIDGTILLVVLGVIVAAIVGVSTAVWVTQYAPQPMRTAVRLAIDVLFGVPSIVVGYALYVALVETAGWGFSLIAGALALAIIMLPYITRSADLALSGVPRELTEGATALGARQLMVLGSVAFPWALPGILTGILISIGIALGETAPLIYTAGWSNYYPTAHLTHSPVAYLTYVVWTYIGQPDPQAHELAYAAALLLMALILTTNFVARAAVEYWALRSRGR